MKECCKNCIYPFTILSLNDGKVAVECQTLLTVNNLSGCLVVEADYRCHRYVKKGVRTSCASGGSGASLCNVINSSNAHAPDISTQNIMDEIRSKGFAVGWKKEKPSYADMINKRNISENTNIKIR